MQLSARAFPRKCLCTLVMLRVHAPYVSKPAIFQGASASQPT